MENRKFLRNFLKSEVKKKVIEKWNDRSVLLIYFLDLLGLLEVLYLHKISLRVKNANMFTSHFFKLTEMIR